MKFRHALLSAVAGAAIAASPLAAADVAKPVFGSWGYDPASMDAAVKPGDDFWAFVNGSWDRKTPIAADRASAGPFVTLSDKSEEDVRQIVDALAARGGGERLSQQVGDYYGSWMDQATVDRLGGAPLKPYLAKIAAVRTRGQLLSLFVAPGYASPVDLDVATDLKDPTKYTVYAGQAQLGMPSREYYLSADAKMVAHRAAYRDFLLTVQKLAGLPGGAASVDRMIALETALSEAQWAKADTRDIDKIYNPRSRPELAALAPQFQWNATLAKAGLPTAPTVVMLEPSAITGAGKLLVSTPLSTWREWLALRFVADHASLLSKPFDDAGFAFYSKDLSGIEKQRDRWKRGVRLVNGALGEAVGEIYVRDHYPAESERQMGELIDNLRTSYQQRIANAGWMDDPTRKEALAKLAAFEPRIGHPAKYIDYSSLKVVRGDLLGNGLRASDFEWKLKLKRFPHPVDRTLWGMTPQTINAYYDPTTNQITFPAAILQAPFFDPAADPAVNYGAIGAVIGHEMGHGFDDQGRKFDGQGRLHDWWTPVAVAAYSKHTAALVEQYNGFSPYPGVNINGKLTLGENLGDLGGIEAAYGAYRHYVAQHGDPPVLGGMTGDQRFFIGWAQAWQGKDREDAERQQILTDPHSPDKYRTNGIVRNVDAWYKAFNVQPGDKLYLPPEQRVHIW